MPLRVGLATVTFSIHTRNVSQEERVAKVAEVWFFGGDQVDFQRVDGADGTLQVRFEEVVEGGYVRGDVVAEFGDKGEGGVGG